MTFCIKRIVTAEWSGMQTLEEFLTSHGRRQRHFVPGAGTLGPTANIIGAEVLQEALRDVDTGLSNTNLYFQVVSSRACLSFLYGFFADSIHVSQSASPM